MMLTNLADPEWITVDCNEPVTHYVFCVFEDKNNQSTIVSTAEILIYNVMCLIINNTCYLFEYYKICNCMMHINIPHISMFQHLFDAVSVAFPPIFVDNFKYMMTFQRYGGIYLYEKQETNKTSADALSIATGIPFEVIIGGNIFNCTNNVFISISFICNSMNDCPGDFPQDEIGCESFDQIYHTSKCKFYKFGLDFYLTSKYDKYQMYPMLKTLGNSHTHEAACEANLTEHMCRDLDKYLKHLQAVA